MSRRDPGVALIGLANLLRAGVAPAQALDATPGLSAVAERVRGGAGLGAALADALPEFAPMLQDGPTLPDRVERIGALNLRRSGLARRLAVASAYPMTLAVGLLCVCVALWWVRRPANAAFEGMVDMRSQLGWLAVGVAVFIAAVWGWIRRRAPIGMRFLPGGRVWALCAAADYVASYALHRDPLGGDRDPAAARASMGPVPDDVAPLLAVAEAAPDPLQALNDAVERLELAASQQARHLALTLSTGLLLVIALGVVGLAWSGLFTPVFTASRGLP